jgi:aminoglycoside phosphotransferase (APT) family kinase protein
MPELLMAAAKMHVDEVDTDVSLVCRLFAAQFPHWADLPIEPVRSAGTDNALYRPGQGMVVRLPRIDWAVGQVDKEQQWLPRLAPQLPLAIASSRYIGGSKAKTRPPGASPLCSLSMPRAGRRPGSATGR